MRSIPALPSTRHLKVVVYFGQNLFISLTSIYSVMKVSHYKWFDLVANHFHNIIMEYMGYNATYTKCKYGGPLGRARLSCAKSRVVRPRLFPVVLVVANG